MRYSLAIDIGASSGRHIVGCVRDGRIECEEIYRFANGMDNLEGHLVWDTDRLFCEVKEGIRRALLKYPDISSVSIDTWGVDYVLMRGDTEVAPTYAYRDSRTDGPIDAVHAIIPFDRLYSISGIQFNKFNSIYQLYADKLAGRLEGVTDFLMIPEYLMYKLTGVKCKEYTDATTTGMLNCRTGDFDESIIAELGFPKEMFGKLNMPGTLVGRFTDAVAAEVGGNMEVVLCPTHDTAAAVEAIEMSTDSPYVSSGTWSLLGVKTERAINDDKSRLSDYSNEGGVGYNRYQKNITGMWIVQCLRRELCPDTDYGEIAAMAEKSSYDKIFDVNDDAFMAPESMKEAIDEYLKARGVKTPVSAADYFSAAYHSIAYGYKVAIDDLESNTGRSYSEIYIVGGGAKNKYLNHLTECYTYKRVVALPIEATSIGNLKTQLKRLGEIE